MVWIKYYSSLLYIYFIPLRYVPWTYQFLCSTPLWLSSEKKKCFSARICNNEIFHTQAGAQRDKKKKGEWLFWKIDSDDNDNRKGCLFRISTWTHTSVIFAFCFSIFSFPFLFRFFPFFHEMITTNFIITFPISESVENYYLLFQVIFVRSQTINKHQEGRMAE